MDFKKWTIFSLLDAKFLSKIKLACVFGNLGNEALLVTKDDDVYALGSNAAGCLGLGSLQSTLQPKRVDVLCRKEVVAFVYGSGPHLMAFTASGELYTWGHNGYCELGNGSTNQGLLPALVTGGLGGKRVIEVSCGSHHSLALTSDGEVFAWGQNNCGQVGTGMSNPTNQSAPKKVNSGIGGKRAVAIACGQTSSMAVLENGEVYGWGYNGNGQLGLGNNVNQLNPCRVLALGSSVIVKVACGYAHTLALSDEGKLYAWGANSYGQLATGNKTNSCSPVLICSDIGRIADIAATHYNHVSAAMMLNSAIYMWGQCRGQSVCEPVLTPYTALHEVFACFATPAVMWRSIHVALEEGTRVVDSLHAAFDTQELSDLTIMVREKPIYVHKAVLKIRCQHFRSMFQGHWQEDSQSVLVLDQFSYPVFRAFLQYLYTDQVDLPPETALELLDLANAYCEEVLKKRCERIIRQGITVDNAALLYSTAISYNAKDLEEFCFKFSLNHMTNVVQSMGFASLEEATVKDFILKAARAGAFKS